jgi:hypothetical protein
MPLSENNQIANLFHKLLQKSYNYFPEKGPVKITENHGVYILYDKNKVVVHVGRTIKGKKGLNQRLTNHLNNSSSFGKRYLNGQGHKLRNGFGFRILEIQDHRIRTLLEALAIGTLCPKHIGTGIIG